MAQSNTYHNFESFGRAMKKLGKKTIPKNTSKFVEKAAIQIGNTIIIGTPEDEGIAEANWRTSKNNPDFATIGLKADRKTHLPGFYTSPREGEKRSLDELKKVSKTFDVNRDSSICITNSTAYIGLLNNGHSKQAPAFFIERAILSPLVGAMRINFLKDNIFQ